MITNIINVNKMNIHHEYSENIEKLRGIPREVQELFSTKEFQERLRSVEWLSWEGKSELLLFVNDINDVPIIVRRKKLMNAEGKLIRPIKIFIFKYDREKDKFYPVIEERLESQQ